MKSITRKLTMLTVLIVFSSQLFSQLPPGWDFQPTPTTQIVSVPVEANPNINGNPLITGDWIGVFYTNDEGGYSCGGATEWTAGVNSGIIAFGDDPFTLEKDGFASGEPITYKIYSYGYNEEFFAEVVCMDGLPSGCITYVSNGLSGVTDIWAVLNFTPVWTSPYNPMTFYITAATLNEDNLQVGDEIGIFDVDAYSGEEICVGAGILIEVLTGDVYLEVITSMDDGSIPDQSNGFTPGNNFIFKMLSQTNGLIEEVDISFPFAGYDETFTSQGNAFVELDGTYQSNQYFEPVWNSPYNPMTIYALGAILNESNLLPGDEIGVFDIDPNNGQEICVGFGTLTEELIGEAYLEIIASMDDGALPDQANGFTPGNAMIFKYYSQTQGLVVNIEISFPYTGYDEVFTSQGSAFVELEGSTNPGITFDPVWTTPYNPMTFYITEALLDGIDLDVPAQIGIFDIDPNTGGEICVGAVTLTGIINPANYLEIITSMDDGSLVGEANGFTPGNSFIFKYISEAGQLIEQVTYGFPYTGYDEVFTSQGNAIVNLTGTSTQGEQQVISLPAGWIGVSSYLDPTNPAIENVCAGIADKLEMLQNPDAYYQPGNSASTLDSWDFQSGYFIKVSEGVDLIIQGNPPGTTTINLYTGWNLMPVLSDQDVDIEDIFAGNLNKVEIIKNAVGLDIYWPGKNIASLLTLQPGRSYLIKATEDFTISY